MAVNVSAFANLDAAVVNGVAHQPCPQKHREIVGTRHIIVVVEESVVGRSEGVVEDDTVGDGAEFAELVERAENVEIGGSPCVSAAACITRFGDPCLAAGDVLVAKSGAASCAGTRHCEIGLGNSLLGLPVHLRYHGGDTLGNAVVVMIAEHVKLLRTALHKVVGGAESAESRTYARGAFSARHFGVHGVDRAGSDDEGVGIVLTYPSVENVLIAAEMLGCVAVRESRHLHHVGLVCELDSVDGVTELGAESEYLFSLGRIPRLVRRMEPLAVCDRNEELCADSVDKIDDVDPLLTGHAVLIALGCDARALKIVIGLCRPRARNAHPYAAELRGKLSQTGICRFDRLVPLHQIAHIGGRCDGREHLGSRDLFGCVSLPEGAARDLGHLDVV